MDFADQKFLRRSTWMQGFGLATKFLAPAITLLLARYFPQQDFGYFISFQLLVLSLSRITTLGFDRSLVSTLAEEHTVSGKTRDIAETTWLVSALSIVVLCCAAIFHLGNTQWLILGGLLPWSLLLLWSGILDGLRKPEYRILLVHGCAFFLTPLFAFLFQFGGMAHVSLALGFFASQWFSAAIGFTLLQRWIPSTHFWPIRFPKYPAILRTIPVALAELVPPLLQRMDLWMILYFLGPEKAAIYSVMITLVNGLRTVRQGYDTVVLSLVGTAQGKGDLPIIRETFQHTTQIVAWIQCGIAILLIFFPAKILGLAGRSYVQDMNCLGLMTAGHLIFGLTGLAGQVLIGRGKGFQLFISSCAALVLSASLNFWLIPRWGLQGAALTSSIVLMVQGFMLYALACRQTPLGLFSIKMIPAIAPSIALTGLAIGKASGHI